MLPAWHAPDGRKVLSDKSWLPKPFEIIGSLPAPRRIVYIDRNGETRIGGWLVHHASDTIAHFDERMAEIERTHQPVKKFTQGPWTLWRMEPRKATKRLAP
jgi:hypothetical protein